MKKLAIIFLLTPLAACTTMSGDASRERVALVDPARGAALLEQCSRTGPDVSSVEGYFEPSAQDITALETGAMAALARSRDEYRPEQAQYAGDYLAFDWPDNPGLYVRQYVGYRIAGRRHVYGNFLPVQSGTFPTSEPAIVCDGGPQFFGVEYDLDAGRLVRIAFNGGLGGPFLDAITP